MGEEKSKRQTSQRVLDYIPYGEFQLKINVWQICCLDGVSPVAGGNALPLPDTRKLPAGGVLVLIGGANRTMIAGDATEKNGFGRLRVSIKTRLWIEWLWAEVRTF